MKARHWFLIASVFVSSAGASAFAQPPSIEPLSGLDPNNVSSEALGVSANGAVVVGSSETGNDRRAFRWTRAQGMIDLGSLEGPDTGFSTAFDVSDDGRVVVGNASTPTNVDRAFRWTPEGGMRDLGTIGGQGSSQAFAVSANGKVVVGDSDVGSEGGRHGFRWTAQGGMKDLGSFAGALGASSAQAVSDDGKIVSGFSQAPASEGRLLAFRWRASGMDNFGSNAVAVTGILGMSGDGRFFVGAAGDSLNDEGLEAAQWKSNGKVQKLPNQGPSLAFEVSTDGQIAVGTTLIGGSEEQDATEEATIWRNGKPIPLAALLASAGVDLGDWSSLSEATAVSADGRVVVGAGTLRENDDRVAFRAVLPNRAPEEPAPKIVSDDRVGTKARVTLSAKADDPDSDELVVRWRVEGKVRETDEIGAGRFSRLTFDFPQGESLIEVEVSDGERTTSVERIVRVTSQKVSLIAANGARAGSTAVAKDASPFEEDATLDGLRLSGLALANGDPQGSLQALQFAESATLAGMYAGATGEAEENVADRLAQRQLRQAQSILSDAAAQEHLRAFLETGDEADLEAAIKLRYASQKTLSEMDR